MGRLEDRLEGRGIDVRSSLTVVCPPPAWVQYLEVTAADGLLYFGSATHLSDVPWADSLARFVRIERVGDALRFAAKYGRLGVCVHRRAKSQQEFEAQCEQVGCVPAGVWYLPAFPWYFGGLESCPFCDPMRFSSEPIEAWLYHARQLRAALTITADLRAGRPPAAADQAALGIGPAGRWTKLDGWPVSGLLDQWLTDAHSVRLRTYAGPYNPDDGRVRVTLPRQLMPGEYALTLTAAHLRGVLAIQLAGALTSVFGLYRCDRCSIPFEPSGRRPWSNGKRRALCPECRGDPETEAERRRARYARCHPVPQRASHYRSGERL